VSAVDESPLTGESLPVDKQVGAQVFAGTLNQFGALTVVVDRTGEQTTVGQIARMVAESTARKTPLERTADRLARYFLPVVLLAALATLIGWRLQSGTWQAGWMPALAVLVVACPCPLVLATPSAVMAAMAWLARNGIVIKGSIALEQLAGIDTFAFDKTGTLTRGQLAVGECRAVAGLNEAELLRLAAAAEKPSEHLLARAIVRAAEAHNLVVPGVSEFTATPGLGVTARLADSSLPVILRSGSGGGAPRTLVVGNRRLLEACGVDLSPIWHERVSQLEKQGQSVLLVALGDASLTPAMTNGALPAPDHSPPASASRHGQLLGLIGMRDEVRPESRRVLEELRQLGIRSFALLTGDRPQPAHAVLETLGPVDFVGTELLPGDKRQWIEEQTRAGRRVAMVGDGINDAPALAAATVGLALGGVGSDLAAEAGQLVLMGDPLAPLPSLVRMSRQLVRIIRQGIFLFAFGMNGLGVLLSAWGWLSPVGGAVFHEVASLAVMLNALRLLWFESWETTRWGRVSQTCGRCADRLAAALSPSRAVYGLVRRRRILVKLAFLTALAGWLCSNVVILSECEQAVVTRCGRYEVTLGAGPHFRWPPPWETIHRENVGLLRALPLGFRATQGVVLGAGAYTPPVEWQAEHATNGFLPVPAESQLLTGDETAVELTAEVHFGISDLRTYRLQVRSPEETLRVLAESAVRQVVASRALDGLLADHRRQVEVECLQLLRDSAARLDLGLEVAQFTLLDVHPPPQVVAAYRDAANALEEREQSINLGQAQHARLVLSAAGEEAVRRLNRSADDPAVPATDSSTTGELADWRLDDPLWAALTDETSGEMLLSGEGAVRLLAAQRERTRAVETARGREARFSSLLPEYQKHGDLTRFQLFWEAIEQTLSQRPLTILDPRSAGRRQIWLTDPERMPQPLPWRGTSLVPETQPPDLEQ
ncbi:MAG: cation-translocating P-type ATPase family protein, partial [Planctomycetales bacterium]